MSELAQVLCHLVPVDDPAALVDASSGDDAAVYRISDDRALVVTVDFFTPMVDDARAFGRIGAANALSDIYAMGAKPLLALNLVGFPRALLGEGILDDILAGGGEVCQRAGIPVLGGHSVDDPEPKFGMVVVGEVHPDRILKNAGAQAGDRIVLTKPIGSGVVATAHKADDVSDEVLEAAVDTMSTLNRAGAEAMTEVGVHAATDVTGYGLLGHLRTLLRNSDVSADLVGDSIPLLPGVRELVARGHVPGGSRRNAEDLSNDISFAEGVSEDLRIVFCDAQTSGGLLIVVSPERTDELLSALEWTSTPGRVIGAVTEGAAGKIHIR